MEQRSLLLDAPERAPPEVPYAMHLPGRAFWLTLLVGVGSTALLFLHFVRIDQQVLVQTTERAAQALVNGVLSTGALNPAVMEVEALLSDIQAEVGAGRAVDAALLQEKLWREPPLGLESTTLEYLPRVSAAEVADRPSLRTRLGNDENSGLPLQEAVGDRLQPLSPRDDYFPVMVEAAADQPRAVIGVDYSADPLNSLAMIQARDTGTLSSYTHFPTSSADDMLITRYLYPLYDTPLPPTSVDERRRHHVGFISAVSYFSAEFMLPFLPESYQGIEASFYPMTPDAAALPQLNDPALAHASYDISGLQMGISARPTRNLQRALATDTRWWVLGCGLALTAWMASMLLWNHRQQHRIIRVVEQRTRDLAERTKSLSTVNAALRDSEARYRMLANNVSDVIYTHDMDGICTWISPSVRTQIGHTEADCIGKPIYTHMTPAAAERTRSAIQRTVANYRNGAQLNLGTHPHELEICCRDGSMKPVEVTISGVYDDAGTLIAFMGVMRDVSARKQAEKEKERLQDAYRQAQKMEAIGTLAGGIAHDFNNLLTGVIGHADLLKLEFSEVPQARHSLDVIEMAALRAKDLTSQLLGFARKGQYQLVPVEINQVITDVVALIERTLDRNIVIRQQPSAENPVVMGDPAQISQIFLNLAVNARDAMPKGGTLDFKVGVETLDAHFCNTHVELKPGRYSVITVSDSGIGIPRDKLEHIFEPFFTDKPAGKGTGLGLAMVYGVTRNHNGTVTVYSEPGKGSTFRVYLPISAAQASVPRQKPHPLVRGSGHVLLVDDQDIVRQIGTRMLQQLGYRVSLAEDGMKGLALYRDHWQDIDLVIIDMVMPNMGGLECIEAMHAVNPALKAILCSGFSRDSIADKINEDHIIGFLQKPFRLQELSEFLASIQR